jgi:dolichyl-phosphate-mannose--protein O-mannosyl transferase
LGPIEILQIYLIGVVILGFIGGLIMDKPDMDGMEVVIILMGGWPVFLFIAAMVFIISSPVLLGSLIRKQFKHE